MNIKEHTKEHIKELNELSKKLQNSYQCIKDIDNAIKMDTENIELIKIRQNLISIKNNYKDTYNILYDKLIETVNKKK